MVERWELTEEGGADAKGFKERGGRFVVLFPVDFEIPKLYTVMYNQG